MNHFCMPFYRLVNVSVCMHDNLSHNIVGLHASTLLVLDVKLFTTSDFHHTVIPIQAVQMACGFVENVSSNRKPQGKSLVWGSQNSQRLSWPKVKNNWYQKQMPSFHVLFLSTITKLAFYWANLIHMMVWLLLYPTKLQSTVVRLLPYHNNKKWKLLKATDELEQLCKRCVEDRKATEYCTSGCVQSKGFQGRLMLW